MPHDDITWKHVDKMHRNLDFKRNRHHPLTAAGKGIPPVDFEVTGHIVSVVGKNVQRFPYPNKNPD